MDCVLHVKCPSLWNDSDQTYKLQRPCRICDKSGVSRKFVKLRNNTADQGLRSTSNVPFNVKGYGLHLQEFQAMGESVKDGVAGEFLK